MSEVKPYKLPEEKTSIVSDSMAVRITPDTDIVTLRHNVMDAVYTTDQNALLRFHSMKYSVSYHETVCFKRRNTLFHPVKQSDTARSRFRPIGKEFCFTRKRIRLLLHNDCKRLRVYTLHNSKKAVTAD